MIVKFKKLIVKANNVVLTAYALRNTVTKRH